MGVHCEINLFKPADGAFVPGSTVSGIIKYAVDKETVFSKITISLKGNGDLTITDESKKGSNENLSTKYENSEKYVDIEKVVQSSEKSEPTPIGAYEIPFEFTLPQNLPPSLDYYGADISYKVRCYIKYYISIKFDRPGVFKFAKRMKNEITVVSGIKPRLPMDPTIYGEQKKVLQLFSRKPNVVNIKATIENSVIALGGKLQMKYEVFNQTNLNLKGVETKLIETYSFTTHTHPKVTMSKEVKGTDSKTGSIKSGESLNMDMLLDLPSDISSLEYSKLVSRDYFVLITAEIPFPHLNARLEVPIQIGDHNLEPSPDTFDDPPPSYWVVMAEDKNREDGGESADKKS